MGTITSSNSLWFWGWLCCTIDRKRKESINLLWFWHLVLRIQQMWGLWWGIVHFNIPDQFRTLGWQTRPLQGKSNYCWTWVWLEKECSRESFAIRLVNFRRFLGNVLKQNTKIFYQNIFSETSHHVLIGLPSGSLLLAGGRGFIWKGKSAIWLLQNDIWNQIGDLQSVSLKM